MSVDILPVGPMQNRSYLIVCEETRKAAIVDPAWETDTLASSVAARKAELVYLLCTHGHFDHINVLPDMLERFPEAVAVYHKTEKIGVPAARSRKVSDGQKLPLGRMEIAVMHTPGHTPGSVTYLAGDHAFFGDTLFSGEGCGRVDFYGDGPREMAESLRKIRALPDHLIVCSGHKYGAYDTTTMKFEKENNQALLFL